MLQSQDFKELLSILARHEVRYLVIGGYAVMLYSEPRWTKDLDLWIAIDPANARAVFNTLKEFGAPLTGLTSADFSEPGYFYQMGNPPLRVDVMMEIPGGDFHQAWTRRNTVAIGDYQVHFISREDLIAVKLASGRDQDLKDVEAIRKS
jgi:predicted nucleotidyltransferase